jgi:hypothetical protein
MEGLMKQIEEENMYHDISIASKSQAPEALPPIGQFSGVESPLFTVYNRISLELINTYSVIRPLHLDGSGMSLKMQFPM